MKLKIEVPYGEYIVLPASPDLGVVIAGLAQASLYKSNGYGINEKHEASNSKIKLEILSDDFDAEIPDPLKKIQAQAALSESRWLEYYNKSNRLEKELTDANEKLKAIAAASTI